MLCSLMFSKWFSRCICAFHLFTQTIMIDETRSLDTCRIPYISPFSCPHRLFQSPQLMQMKHLWLTWEMFNKRLYMFLLLPHWLTVYHKDCYNSYLGLLVCGVPITWISGVLRRDEGLDFMKFSVYLLIWVVYVFTLSHYSTCLAKKKLS